MSLYDPHLSVLYNKKLHSIRLGSIEKNIYTGRQIITLIGYDRDKLSTHQPSIIQILPLILYLPACPHTYEDPEKWDEERIRRYAQDVLQYHLYPKTSQERQFYQRFLKNSRANKNLTCRVEQFFIPVSDQWLETISHFTVVPGDRLALAYEKNKTHEQHIADVYYVYTTYHSGDMTSKIITESLTPILVTDEDYFKYTSENSDLGKLTFQLPLDSPVVHSMFNHSVKVREREVEYTGDIDPLAESELYTVKEKVQYQGNVPEIVNRWLLANSTLSHDNGIFYSLHQNNYKDIKYDNGVVPILHGDIMPLFDENTNPNTSSRAATTIVSHPLPYHTGVIRKLYPLKLNPHRELILKYTDMI